MVRWLFQIGQIGIFWNVVMFKNIVAAEKYFQILRSKYHSLSDEYKNP